MNKRFLAILIAAFATSHVTAGSLDVYGDIKVNGKTVIDAQGNYVGSLPSQVDYVSLSAYLDDDGLKKTYIQSETQNSTVVTSTRIDDATTPNVKVYKYFWSGDAGVYVSTETYLSPTHWITEGKFCQDPSCDNFSSYNYTDNEKTVSAWSDKTQVGGNFLDSYTLTSVPFDCDPDYEEESPDNKCDISGGSYTPDYYDDSKYVSNVSQVVFVLNKTNFKKDSLSYDDCITAQFSGNFENPWTGIYCKDVGMVRGWNNSGYSVELISVEGTPRSASSNIAISTSLKARTAPNK